MTCPSASSAIMKRSAGNPRGFILHALFRCQQSNKGMLILFRDEEHSRQKAHPVNLATGVAPFFEDHSLDVYKIFSGCLSECELFFLDAGGDSAGSRGLCRSTTQSRHHRVEIRGTECSVCAHESQWLDAIRTLPGAHACL